MEVTLIFAGIIAVVLGTGVFIWRQSRHDDTVFEYQKGLLFHKGRLTRIVDAGAYALSRKHDYLYKMDMRPILYSVPGQEILTKDKISIKLTAGGTYAINDPKAAFTSSVSYAATFYADAQGAMRDIISQYDLETLLGDRTAINAALHEALAPKAIAIGLELKDFIIRDIMLPAGLKKAFGGLLEAQKEAQVALEKARGEQAVLRSLANTSRLYSEHPSLLSARLMQALDTGAHTLVINADKTAAPLVVPQK